ncbi:MAG: hypothetical protein JWP11_1629 [Frankiales bacterium]|nr:hypothetical protein [Frankiales bacterium]
MRQVPRAVAVPFLLALFGVLLMLGIVIGAVAGPVAVFFYAGLIVAPLVVGSVSSRRRASRLASGRTCTCCTGTVHDPVQVI